MKFEPELLSGKLKRRYKRFFADVELDSGELVVAHCPNTGSMKNCLVEDGPCWLSESNNPKRKLKYTLEAVTAKYGGMAGVNTGRTNKLVKEALELGLIKELAEYENIEAEVKFGEENSRLDFCLSKDSGERCYVEVKNLTLGMEGGLGVFPDAVTTRGTKHLRELAHAIKQGHRAALFFCAQHTAVNHVQPAWDIDSEYCKTLKEVMESGVRVLCYSVKMSRDGFIVDQPLPFSLGKS